MESTHPLNLNLRQVISCLTGVLSQVEAQKIEEELRRNVRQALRLSETHLRSARAMNSWRNVVSRGYYCCYCASRAIRLAETGIFSTETDDHKKVGNLPAGFPNRAVWSDVLTKFRADRNLGDYDHTARPRNLEYSSGKYLVFAGDFLNEAKRYLRARGII